MKTLEHPLPLTQPWSDRFRTPCGDQLVSCLPRALRPATDLARRRLSREGTAQERLRWMGIWRWSFAYEPVVAPHPARSSQPSPSGQPGAYVIPDPRVPRICIPVGDLAATQTLARPCPGFVREVIERCSVIAGIRWATWNIEGKAMVDELLDALRLGL